MNPGLTKQKQILLRVLLFLLLFIIASGVTGPWIISTKLLYGFYFFIYGNLGKMVIVSSIIFALLGRGKLKLITFSPGKLNFFYIFLSAVLFPVFFSLARMLLKEPGFDSNIFLFLSAHLTLILIPALLIPGIFGRQFIRKFARLFKKEILICLALSILFDLTIFQVWKLWPYFAKVVLSAVYFLFSLTFTNTSITYPYILTVNNFSVQIAQACSGVDSLFLFSSLYIIFGILDWKVFNKAKLILMFFPAALGLFLVNILRVYLLILIGVLFSPDLALKLFHTYAGMILFIIYFVVFWKLFYRSMIYKK